MCIKSQRNKKSIMKEQDDYNRVCGWNDFLYALIKALDKWKEFLNECSLENHNLYTTEEQNIININFLKHYKDTPTTRSAKKRIFLRKRERESRDEIAKWFKVHNGMFFSTPPFIFIIIHHTALRWITHKSHSKRNFSINLIYCGFKRIFFGYKEEICKKQSTPFAQSIQST